MLRLVLLLSLATSLSACGSITHPLPKCDGYSRRPLNRSMWPWEDNSATKQQTSNAASATSRAASFAEEPASTMPAAIAHFDVAGSYRPCEVK